MTYRFYLDNKRAHGFRKGRCPQCGKKDHFTYYIDRDAPGGPAIFNEECGICDTPGCYHKHPSDWLKENGKNTVSNASVNKVEYVPKETLYIDKYWVQLFHDKEHCLKNNFILFLLDLPINLEDIVRAYEMYWFGSTQNGMAIWWRIDTENRVRTAKMMLYKRDGHRDREAAYNFDWIHSKLQRNYRDSNGVWHPPLCNFSDKEMVQCLFGLHLLNAPANKGKPVAIVESEKSAFICSMLLPEYIWMATASINGFTYLMVLPIIEAGREMVVFPDYDGYDDWIKKAELIKQQSKNARITVSQAVKRQWTPTDGKKADIADILIRRLIESEFTNDVSAIVHQQLGLKQKNVILDNLITKLDLVPEGYEQ